MGQTGLCPSKARQAPFPEEQTNPSAQIQQCYLASSGEKCTLSGNLGELHILMVSTIVRQIFKYKHKLFKFYFYFNFYIVKTVLASLLVENTITMI